MSVITLPYSMEQDRINQIKANSTHVDANFDVLLDGVNGKLDLDGTSSPVADISWAGHKITTLAAPTVSGDAANKGYVDTALLTRAPLASPILTGSPQAPTQPTTDDSDKLATTGYVRNVLEAMYPVGAIFIGTTNTCPMAALFGTWELVEAGKALWTGNGESGSGITPNADYANAPANTTIGAGLPNHTHNVAYRDVATWGGAFNGVGSGGSYFAFLNVSSSGASNSIYGKSTTVQPPAYVVNVWRRTA